MCSTSVKVYLSAFRETNCSLAALKYRHSINNEKKKKKEKKISALLTLHLVTVGGLSRLRRGEARAVAEEARLSGGLGLIQTPLCLYACPQWT